MCSWLNYQWLEQFKIYCSRGYTNGYDISETALRLSDVMRGRLSTWEKPESRPTQRVGPRPQGRGPDAGSWANLQRVRRRLGHGAGFQGTLLYVSAYDLFAVGGARAFLARRAAASDGEGAQPGAR